MLRLERRFSLPLAGNLLSRVGDGVHEFVFLITVLEVTENGIGAAGIIYFFRFIPYLVLGPTDGVLADRVSRKALMLGADIARAVVTAAFRVLLVRGEAGCVALAAFGMLMTALRTLFQPAFQAAIPALVEAKRLLQTKGAIQIGTEIGGTIGPALGGAALAMTSNPGFVLAIDAVTLLFSTACVAAIRIPSVARAVSSTDARLEIRNLYTGFSRNLHDVFGHRQPFITIVCSSACILLVSATLRVLIPAMMRDAGLPDGAIGYAMSATALGTVFGALACTSIACNFDTRRLMSCWCLYGLASALLPFCMIGVAAASFGCLILGVVGAFVDVALPTVIQRLSNDDNLGKNFSLFSTLANTGEALSSVLAGMVVLFAPLAVGVSLPGVLVALIAYAGRRVSAKAYERRLRRAGNAR